MMIMYVLIKMKIFIYILCSVLLIFISISDAVKDFNKMNLVQVNMSNYIYKRLMMTKDNTLSAPPLAFLDRFLLKRYVCYKNLRSNLWSLGIPILFWNDTYMGKIAQSIQNRNQLKNFTSGKIMILPPSGIVSYRINWRRPYIDDAETNQMVIDSSWQDAQTDYVLPMRHSFIMEFNAGNESKQLCSDTKSKLLNEPLQSFEMTIEFLKSVRKIKKIPDFQIKINDIKSAKLYNDSGCKGKPEHKCFVSKEFAERWAYDVSSKIMDSAEMIHLNLQKDIFDIVFEYLCKEKISIFEIEIKTVARLSSGFSNEMVCKIPNNVYISKLKPCDPKYDRYGYLRHCPPVYFDFGNEVVSNFNPYQSFDEKTQFSVPVTHF